MDLGRPGTRSLGVPVGGAADRAALAIGNGLVGNPPDTLALEINLSGPTLEANCLLACVLFGAPFTMNSDRQQVVAGKTFTLQPGEKLTIGGTFQRMRAYFCVRGGFSGKTVLGSSSGLEPVRAGEVIECQPGVIQARFLRHPGTWERPTGTLRAIDGVQAEWFRTEEFFGQEFTVTPASNRMGLRLKGEPLTMPARELVSEPVCPGAVQVTRDGQCIILGVDGQTIGGYPKIAQVITADGDLLGQLRPGERVKFQRVTLEAAEQAHYEREKELREWITRLRTAEVLASPNELRGTCGTEAP